ncbi:hypothetical protein [Streptomyces sp. PA5.6]|uniref:hypothetical protein n=1 Tax=Streptomyces sp. PA5.6 TaxID=3035651 RepID=UPI003904835F
MLPTLITAALAIVATLLGAIVSGRFQERAAERQVRATHGEAIRRDRLEAVTALACAVSDHRTAMWRRGDAVLKQAASEQIETLRGESHITRSAVTRPLLPPPTPTPRRQSSGSPRPAKPRRSPSTSSWTPPPAT